MSKGFILAIDESGASRLRFIGYDGEEGHKRSHALREAMARDGAQMSITSYVADEGHAREGVKA